jgi:pimeloyl-ACP methyl ester carboxylesterase
MRYLYLHGFASSPDSRKARFFIEKLNGIGIRLEALNLAPDFRNLTISSQLAVIHEAAHNQQVVLIGSSLGGYLAALYAAGHPETVDRMLLLAPAFDFHRLWQKELGAGKLSEWRESGTILIYHYGAGRKTPLGFQLMEDAAKYPAFPNIKQPCLILHGLNDEVVPYEKSARFAAGHPDNAKLLPVDSGHELTDVLNEIWDKSSSFLSSTNHREPI